MNRLGLGLVAAAGLCLAAGAAMLKTGAEAEVSPAPKAEAVAPAAAPAPKAEVAAPAAPAATQVAEDKPADAAPAAAPAAPAEAPAAAAAAGEKKIEAGKWVLPDGTPTFNVVAEKLSNGNIAIRKVDWYTYSGWRRYHAECHVCHGPNAEGSSFAPALADSLKTIDYAKFMQVVSSGQRRNVGGTDFIMPALGDNKNVMCYIDDLYIYLKARASGELLPGRLSADQRDEKPAEAKEYEEQCLK